MENPLFVPELMWPTAETFGPQGTTPSASEWVISESTVTPIYITTSVEETCEDKFYDIMPNHMTHSRRVPSR